MRMQIVRIIIIICILAWNLASVHGTTDQDDVMALTRMYQYLNSAPQLTNWNSNGDDPCGQSWKGISCSGSAVTEINLSGLGLTGSLDYWLSNLGSVTRLDLSNNNLNGMLPYSLPPRIQELNLAGNSFNGNLPYFFNQRPSLRIINLSRNQFDGQLPDVFAALSDLSTLDLSSNKLTGDLPEGFRSLSSITTMNLQNNQFTGHIDVLANLPLRNLNVANNHFTGWIPNQLKDIDNLQTSGNSWSSGPAPPPPPFTPPPGRKSSPGGGSGGNGSSNRKSGIGGGGIAGIIISLLVVGAIIAFFLVKSKSRRSLDNEKLEQNLTFAPLTASDANEMKSVHSTSSVEIKTLEPTMPVTLKPPPFERNKSFDDDDVSSKVPVPVKKYDTGSISAIQYTIADLQIATGSFNVDNVLGEGPTGRVYRAQFDNGKILAVKKISSSAVQTPNSEIFLETVSNISHLRHPNISELVGYCFEHGQHLLVYEFYKNGSLHDFLHLSDGYNKPLTWSSRIKIALGTARALEYLHEVCSPSIIHKNFKSSNILLDGELNPYLSGSGMFNFLRNPEHEDTSAGYSAPEVDMSGQYTMKSDVYSFGVVMLELLTGRKPFDSSRQRSEQSLVRWAYPQLHDIDALAKMVDPGLEGLYPPKSLSRLADVVALCVQPEPEFRPPMSEVVQALVRLVQRANMSKRTAAGDGSGRRGSDQDLDENTL